MLELEQADRALAEAQGDHDDAARLGAPREDARITQRVGDEDDVADVQRLLAQRRELRVRDARWIEVALDSLPDVLQLSVLEPTDPERLPVDEPMGELLNPLERIADVDIGGDDLFHREDLVQLLGGDRLLEDPLEEQSGQ